MGSRIAGPRAGRRLIPPDYCTRRYFDRSGSCQLPRCARISSHRPTSSRCQRMGGGVRRSTHPIGQPAAVIDHEQKHHQCPVPSRPRLEPGGPRRVDAARRSRREHSRARGDSARDLLRRIVVASPALYIVADAWYAARRIGLLDRDLPAFQQGLTARWATLPLNGKVTATQLSDRRAPGQIARIVFRPDRFFGFATDRRLRNGRRGSRDMDGRHQ
jgi:hypothetical protein